MIAAATSFLDIIVGELAMNIRIVGFYTCCIIIPMTCLALGYVTEIPSKWLNGVIVISLLVACYLGRRLVGPKW